jgi:general secretion pathway protein L
MSLESEWLPMATQSEWVKEGEEYLPLTAYSPLPELSLAEGQEWQNTTPELVMELLAKGAVASKINLLTGTFKPKSQLNRHWKTWRKVAMAAVFLLAVVLVDNVLQIQRYEAQAQAYRAESERIFRQALPGKKKIPTVSYLKREMNSEASRLSGGGSESSMLELMTQMPPLLKQMPTLSLTSFKYDSGREEIRLQAQGSDFQTFEKATELFSTRFKVTQGQLNRSGTVVNGSFVLTPL